MDRPVNVIKQLIIVIVTMFIVTSMYGVSAYAWYVLSITNSDNRIQSGRYDYSLTYSSSADGEYASFPQDGFYDQVIYVKISNIGDAYMLAFQYRVTDSANASFQRISPSGSSCIVDVGEEHIYRVTFSGSAPYMPDIRTAFVNGVFG